MGLFDRACRQRLLDELGSSTGIAGRHGQLHHLKRCRFATACCRLATEILYTDVCTCSLLACGRHSCDGTGINFTLRTRAGSASIGSTGWLLQDRCCDAVKAEMWPIACRQLQSLSTQIRACAAGSDRARSLLAETASAGPLAFVTHTAAW